VDDTKLMGIPSAKEARAFKKILDDFMEASGISINHLKSQIFFFSMPLLNQISCYIYFSIFIV
jgi:hypothetical protein